MDSFRINWKRRYAWGTGYQPVSYIENHGLVARATYIS